jgi:hypothetical protein
METSFPSAPGADFRQPIHTIGRLLTFTVMTSRTLMQIVGAAYNGERLATTCDASPKEDK